MAGWVRRAAAWSWIGVWIALLALPVGEAPAVGFAARAHAQGADDRALVFFETVRGTLGDTTPSQDWTFDGSAGQVIAVLAITTRGDLDPVLHVIAPSGAVAGEDDDLDSLVHDAGLEALTLAEDGPYTIRVARYLGEQGQTAGDYDLTVTPGFARVALRDAFSEGEPLWTGSDGEPIPLAQERLRMRVLDPGAVLTGFPPGDLTFDDAYVQVEARLFGSPVYAEFGFVVRAQGAGLASSYQIKINTDGRWRALYQDESGVYALRTWTSSDALAALDGTWRLGVLARGSTLALYADDRLVGTVTDDRLTSAGQFGLLVATGEDQTDPVTVLFDNLTITARLGTTYTGLPLALRTWASADPAVTVNELAESGNVVPQPSRDLYLTEKSLMATDRTSVVELVGSERAIYRDFVLSAAVSILTPNGDAGCGLVYRWADERSMDVAYVDTAGGFGLVQTRDGQLLANVYDLSPMVATEPNRLLIIAQGNQVAYYVNGALVTQETVLAGEGRVGVALFNYESRRTDCFWSDIWVWPLEP